MYNNMFIPSLIWGFLFSVIAGSLIPFLIVLVFRRNEWKYAFVMIIALALVGVGAGMAAGLSRAEVMGSVIPALLGFLGAISIYIFGSDKSGDQSRAILSSLGVASLSCSLFFGYFVGENFKIVPTDHRDIRAHCARAYTDAKLLGDDAAFERFYNQMGNLCYKSMYWNVTENSAP